MSSCSLFKENVDLGKYVSINSTPPQAEVYSIANDFLGVTPLRIPSDKVDQISKNGVVSLSLRKVGHYEKQVSFRTLGVADLSVNLNPLGEKEFVKLLAGPLSNLVNDIIKDVMTSQENIVRKNYKDARVSLDRLIQTYPAISSNYILRAAIDINDKKFKEARLLLLKALNLDETNEVAKSYLQYVERRIRQ